VDVSATELIIYIIYQTDLVEPKQFTFGETKNKSTARQEGAYRIVSALFPPGQSAYLALPKEVEYINGL
jgi:hypothetical protein